MALDCWPFASDQYDYTVRLGRRKALPVVPGPAL
jgi:hypothetical protein